MGRGPPVPAYSVKIAELSLFISSALIINPLSPYYASRGFAERLETKIRSSNVVLGQGIFS